MKNTGFGQSRPKRSLGQNFLVDQTAISQIISAVDPGPSDLIFEIGPGRGALTRPLVASGAEVIALEVDRQLIPPLQKEFGENERFHVVEQDALSADFPAIFAKLDLDLAKLRSIKLAANLPYYISTPILQVVSRQRHFFRDVVLMFQREVVDRITAKPGNSDRGYLTVLIECAFEVERLFDVPPTAFEPRPKVWSSVVRLVPKPDVPGEQDLADLLSVAFAQKRKTLANNLKSRYSNYASALIAAGIPPTLRAEALSLEEWMKLSAALRSAG